MYIVIGANGFLGSYMVKNILEQTDEDIFAIGRQMSGSNHKRIHCVSCDVRDTAGIAELNKCYFVKSANNKVIYLAAYHQPDLVERNPRIAWDINITALSNFLNTVENVTCFFYPSSDSVYGESHNGYHFCETDALRPVNRYGRLKCTAEDLVTTYGYNVVRFPFLIAPSMVPGKKHFYDTILETILRGESMQMFYDSYRSSLSFDMAAQLTIRLMETFRNEYPQILNICGDDDLSKYDIGLMIAEKAGVPRDLIKPISVNDSNGIFETKRAASTLMDNTVLKRILKLKEVKLTV